MEGADDFLSSQAIQCTTATQRANGSCLLPLDQEHTGNEEEPSAPSPSSSTGAAAMGPRQPLESNTTITFNAPNPAVSYGGIDPVIEENLQLVEPVSEYGLRGTSLSSDKMVDSRWERHFSPISRAIGQGLFVYFVVNFTGLFVEFCP